MTGSLDFQCAIVTGGAGGIGKAIAQYFISKGKAVLLVGRTESKLEATTKEIGAAGYYVLDVGQTSSIRHVVAQIVSERPEVDCLVNNAGVQRPLEVLSDGSFLKKADEEIDINIRGPMHLTLELLPHLRSKSSALIINVSSILGFLPSSIINPVYNGTKAWLHFWSLNLRTQLQHGGASIRVVEIAPPTVGTDLHREREDPDDNKKENNAKAMSIEEFMEELSEKLERGDDIISAGPGTAIVDTWYEAYGDQYRQAASGGN